MKKKKKKFESKKIIIPAIVLIVIIALVFLFIKVDFSSEEIPSVPSDLNPSTQKSVVPQRYITPSTSPQNNVPKEVVVDYSNFVSTLLANQMISDIPKGGSISLNTFNFDTGERQIEKTYILKKDSVYESSEPADIYVNFHSKYINQINSNNLCDILTLANNNGDFGAWSDLEVGTLMWRYKGMLKYRDCLGL